MARKKGKTYLPNSRFTFDETAIVMLKSSLRHYELAINLNRAFNLRLARVPDLQMPDGNYPCFGYYSEQTRLAFVLIEKPNNGLENKGFNIYDKMLLIGGRDAWKFQKRLYDSIHNPEKEPEPSDLLNHRRWVLNNQLISDVFTIDIFGFSERKGKFSSLYEGPEENCPAKIDKYLKNLMKLLDNLFNELEASIDSDEDESDIMNLMW